MAHLVLLHYAPLSASNVGTAIHCNINARGHKCHRGDGGGLG